MIRVDKNGPIFHLRSGGLSYVFGVLQKRYLVHAYWGTALNQPRLQQLVTLGTRPYTVSESVKGDTAKEHYRHWVRDAGTLTDTGTLVVDPSFSTERLAFEYPVSGNGDLRDPALRVYASNGSPTASFRYTGYEIVKTHPGPEGLPYINNPETSCETLRIDMTDSHAGIGIQLYYLPIPELPIVLRWTRIQNLGSEALIIDRAGSASLDIHLGEADVITLNGAWGKERHLNRRRIGSGLQSVQSRGGASSHQHAPFIALAEEDATEDYGQVYAASLIYSGNHRHAVEQNQYGFYRLQCGINPDGFQFRLGSNEHFDTPAAALAWSADGLTGISDAYHGFVRRYLFPEQWRDRDRPIIVNTWEAHYFDVDAKKVVELAKKGKEIGGEVLVLDDGWFKNRSDDKRALGDWIPDESKFPGGLLPTVKKVRKLGIEFGLWVEPEMVNPDSELYRRHPDWVLKAPGRDSVLARNQLVLNLAKPEVVDHLLDIFSGIFSSAPITYVKWDLNRNMAELADPEEPHRYMLGLYRFWHTLNKRFPHILFEGCAGGGGRFDFGSLAYMPQFWTSDQTDAVERQRIQFGSSLLFPPETMGAHVSAVPNHQVGRNTPALTRSLTSLAFNYGYELDLSAETEDDKAIYKAMSEVYKDNRELFRTGRFLRLLPRQRQQKDAGLHRREEHAWAVLSPDGTRAMVFYFRTLAEPNDDGRWLRLRGLKPGDRYRDRSTGSEFESAMLLNRGLWIPPAGGDYRAAYWMLDLVD